MRDARRWLMGVRRVGDISASTRLTSQDAPALSADAFLASAVGGT
ncbi:hypothetical protein [Streptomyces sp. NPDC005953]